MFYRKMKESWPVWFLMIAGTTVILVAVIQKQSQQPVALSPLENQAAPKQDLLPSSGSQNLPPMGSQTTASGQSDPVAAPAMVTTPQQGHEGAFVIQAYSFKEKARADAIMEKMKTQGYPAYVLMSDLGDKGVWYRVRVGAFASAQEAQATLEQLKKDSHAGFITKHVATAN